MTKFTPSEILLSEAAYLTETITNNQHPDFPYKESEEFARGWRMATRWVRWHGEHEHLVISRLEKVVETISEPVLPKPRLKSCVEAWSGCATGEYNPKCCRWPKSCSCTIYGNNIDPKYLEGENGIETTSEDSPPGAP